MDNRANTKFVSQRQQPFRQFAAIENRPITSTKNIQFPPIQNNYPTQIQNNLNAPQYNQRQSAAGRSAIPPALPTVVHPIAPPQSTSVNSVAHHLLRTNTKPTGKTNNNNNEHVIVKIIPSSGWYLNDAQERKSYFQAVSRGLLNENGNVYVNNIQRSDGSVTQPSDAIDLAEEIYFTGPSSYQLPLSSVGKLACDSDSVSNNRNVVREKDDFGYRYDPPCRRNRL